MGVITGVMCCLSHRCHLLEVLWESCVGCVADVVLPMLQVSCVYMSYASGSIGMCWLYYRCHVLAVLQVSCVTCITDIMYWLYYRCHALPVLQVSCVPVIQVSCVGCITGVMCCRCHVGHGMGQQSLSLEG